MRRPVACFPFVAAVLLGGCHAAPAPGERDAEPAAEALRADERPEVIVTEDTQRVHRPDIHLVPADSPRVRP